MELNTDLTISIENTNYRGDITISSRDLGVEINRDVVMFKTDLTLTAYSDDNPVSEIKTEMSFTNNTMTFSVIDYAEVRKSILYFSKFFNSQFEEAYLWRMLATGTTEQINKSHLADVYTAINNLATKINNFLEGTDSDGIINTWKELQDFLKGISGTQDLYTLLKSLVSYDNIMPLLKDRFIRKDQDDTTPYNITFANPTQGCGIVLGDKFSSGATGTGGKIHGYYDTNNTFQTYGELDYLYVRKKATFTQLTIEELKSVGGQIILSPASMKCSEVEIITLTQEDIDNITQSNKYLDSDGTYKTYCSVGDTVFRCYFKKDDGEGTELSNQFVAGDQAKCQTFNTKAINNYAGNPSSAGNRYYWRLVVNTGDDFIDLSQSDCDENSDVPVAEDAIVQLGNRHDATRQSAQILSAYGNDSPSHKMYQGIGTTMYFPSTVEGESYKTSGPYDLYGKDVYGLYYNVDSGTPQNSKMSQYTYGDWYVGTRNQDYRDSDTTFLKFDTDKKQLTLRGVLIQSQYENAEAKPIEFFRGTYTDLVPYYYMDSVVYTDADGTTSTYVHEGKTKTTGINPTNSSVWTAKAKGVKGKDGESAVLKPYLSYFFAYSKYTTSNQSTVPPADLNVWTEAQHSHWTDVPPEYPLPQTEISGIIYYLWMCVVYYKVNNEGTDWEVDTVDNPITYKRVEGEKGSAGIDGTKAPYTDYSFAYSKNLTTDSSTTEPEIIGSWSDSVPSKPTDSTTTYYLWMKVQKMKATEDNSSWEKDGEPTYVKVEGEKGEKGDKGDTINGKDGNDGDSLVVVYTNSSSEPTKPADGKLYPPQDWRTTTAVTGSYKIISDTSIKIDGKTNIDCTTTKEDGYFKITGTSELDTIQCVKVTFKSKSLDSYKIRIDLKVDCAEKNYFYIGNLDSRTLSTDGISGSTTKSVDFEITNKSTHFVYLYYVKTAVDVSYSDSVYFKITCLNDINNFVEEGPIYSCTGTKSGTTGIITWNTPILTSYGDDPVYSYCGDWNSTVQYKGNSEIIHIVSYATYDKDGVLENRSYYKAIRGVGNIPIGVSPEALQSTEYIIVTDYSTSVEITTQYDRKESEVYELSGVQYYSWYNDSKIFYTTDEHPTLDSTLYIYETSGMTAVDSSVKTITEHGYPYYGTDYWVLMPQYSSVATDFLLAQNAAIEKAIIRKLLTDDAPNARIDIKENYLKMYDNNNAERLNIIGDDITSIGTPSTYSLDTSSAIQITCSQGETKMGSKSLELVHFTVSSNNTTVTIPKITFSYTYSQTTSVQIGNSNLHLAVYKINGTSKSVVGNSSVSSNSLVYSNSITFNTKDFTLEAGEYSVEAGYQYRISVGGDVSTTLVVSTKTEVSGQVIVGVGNGNENKISIGANGLVANIGNDFAIQMLKVDGESEIAFLGKNSSGNIIGIKINKEGVKYCQGNNIWKNIGS